MADYHVQENLDLQYIDIAGLKPLGMYKVTSSWGYLYAVVVENLELTLFSFYKSYILRSKMNTYERNNSQVFCPSLMCVGCS